MSLSVISAPLPSRDARSPRALLIIVTQCALDALVTQRPNQG